MKDFRSVSVGVGESVGVGVGLGRREGELLYKEETEVPVCYYSLYIYTHTRLPYLYYRGGYQMDIGRVTNSGPPPPKD